MGTWICRVVGDPQAFVGMVMAVFAQVSNMIVSKLAMSRGTSDYVIVSYSNALSILILFPSSFFFRRLDDPPVTFGMLWRLFFLAIIGCTSQMCGYAGIQYSSPTLGTAMLNLIPAFTFILAIIFRMEKVDWRSSSSQAKSMGTLVSIAGAFIVTFYNGPSIKIPTPISSSSSSPLSSRQLLSPSATWILGGFFFAVESFMTSLWFIVQASIVKKYPAVLKNVSYYCCFLAIQSLVVSIIAEPDLRAWRLKPDVGLIAIVYAGVIGIAFRIGMITWCLLRTGPLYVSMFKPLAIVIAVVMGIIFLGDSLYLGSLVGATIIVCGFYAVMWGKAREEKIGEEIGVESLESPSERIPLLQNRIEDS